ncbi:ribokinase [Bacillus sp. JJ1521]|uniref:ribokinase n=1 Tax=Bacillus sp. JJ1521 TaxID=3122957 RepID=UPI002FFE1DBD
MITVIGSLNVDLMTTVNRYPRLGETLLGKTFQRNFGGKGANQAVAAARLGGAVRMIGCVGQDLFGEEYISHLNKEGILIDNVEPVTHASTGTASIFITEGDNLIVVVPGANFELTPEKIEKYKEIISQSNILLIQLEIPMETIEKVLEIAQEFGIRVILNPAPFRSIPSHWWDTITYLTPNEHEAECLMQEDSFKEEYREKLIITRGNKGLSFFNHGTEIEISAPKVEVVDTTGAGDTFNGALTHFLNEGYSLKEACQYAVHAASLSVTKAGAQGGMPSLQELQDFITSTSSK